MNFFCSAVACAVCSCSVPLAFSVSIVFLISDPKNVSKTYQTIFIINLAQSHWLRLLSLDQALTRLMNGPTKLKLVTRIITSCGPDPVKRWAQYNYVTKKIVTHSYIFERVRYKCVIRILIIKNKQLFAFNK